MNEQVTNIPPALVPQLSYPTLTCNRQQGFTTCLGLFNKIKPSRVQWESFVQKLFKTVFSRYTKHLSFKNFLIEFWWKLSQYSKICPKFWKSICVKCL